MHYSADISFEHIGTLEESGVVTCEVREALGSISAYGAHSNAPYDDVLVRKAISYAIDRDMCNEIMYAGRGAINPTPLPSFTVEGPQNVEGYSHDPDRARELLAEAGYPDGEGLRPLTIQTMDSFSGIAEVVQANLTELGIGAEIDLQEQNAYVDRALQGSVNFGILGIGMGGDASSWGVMFQSGGPFNLAQYENPELDALFDEAAVLTDSAERKALYDQAFQIIEDEAAWVPLLYTTIVHVSTKDLNLSRGLEVGDNNLQPFYVTVN